MVAIPTDDSRAKRSLNNRRQTDHVEAHSEGCAGRTNPRQTYPGCALLRVPESSAADLINLPIAVRADAFLCGFVYA
jgi:hypothetical protein